MTRVCGTPITAVVKGDQDFSACGEGARSAAVAAAAYLPLSRTIASDPSPVVRHANDTAQDARRAGSMDICVAIERPLADGGAYPVRAARRGVRRPAACVFPFPG
jgi:hypothetical protein